MLVFGLQLVAVDSRTPSSSGENSQKSVVLCQRLVDHMALKTFASPMNAAQLGIDVCRSS
jgi:hypothetical protein